jgi:protoporphyrinogen oxidase
LDLVIIGAGPSGLSASLEASIHGARSVVVEKLGGVGGLCRTIPFEGCLYDIGPHRFFTKNAEVHQLFVDTVDDDLLRVSRQTRILRSNKFFDYPLTPLSAMRGVGIRESLRIFGSYAAAKTLPYRGLGAIHNFEDWVISRFGRRLHETFFKSYTEKVWGIPCTEISAEWAEQRIKGLSLTSAVADALYKRKGRTVKTLVDEFIYPRLGAGQFYEEIAERVKDNGSIVETRQRLVNVICEGKRVRAITVVSDTGELRDIEGRHFLFSCPLTELVEMMSPRAPPEVVAACRMLRYRHHIGVNLEVEGASFADNWIYAHSPEVHMARISNYRNFSAAMAGGKDVSPLTVEYFSFPGDGRWEASDESLIRLAIQELRHTGLTSPDQVRAAFVVRSPKAYPVIAAGYKASVEIIRSWLARFENLLPIGRSGMFKYNNQDHAIATGLFAARTALGLGLYDPWQVNIDAEYQEASEVIGKT